MPRTPERFFQFGEFTVDSDQKVLLRNGIPLPLPPKVFDTLLILIENGGRLVKKQNLMSQLWPDTATPLPGSPTPRRTGVLKS